MGKNFSGFRLILLLADYGILPFLIIFFAYEPNMAHGFVEYLEDGQYLSVIQGLFQGKVIYRDLYLFFGPLSYYGPALWMLFLGKTLLALKIYFLTSDILSYLVLYVLCRSFIRNRFFSYVSSLLMVVEGHYPFWSMHWGGFRFACGYLMLFTLLKFCQTQRLKSLALTGVLSALGSLFSFEIGALSFLTVFFLLLYRRTARTPEPISILRSLQFYLAGWLFLFIPFLLFLFASGSFPAFLEELSSVAARSVWIQPFQLGLKSIFKVFYPAVLYSLCFSLIFYHRFKKGTADRETSALLVFTVYGTLSYLFSFRAIQGPQFESILPPAILVSFYLLHQLYEGFFRRETLVDFVLRGLGLFIFMTGFAYLLLSPKSVYGNQPWPAWFFYQRNKNDIIPQYNRFFWKQDLETRPLKPEIQRARGSFIPAQQAQAIEEIVSYVKANSSSEEPVFTFPELGIFNFLCDRPSVSRFTISGFAWPRQKWREEVLEALRGKKPRIVLSTLTRSNLALSIGRKEEILPEIQKYILRHYELKASVEGVGILERKEK